jgi:hypothetical protein
MTSQIATLLLDQHRLQNLINASGGDLATIQRGIGAGSAAEAILRAGPTADHHKLIRSLAVRVALTRDSVSIEVSPEGIFASLGLDLPSPIEPLHLISDAVRVRQGHEIRLVVAAPTTAVTEPSNTDTKLATLLAEAFAARNLVLANPSLSMNALAAREGRCRTRLQRLFKLSYIAPSIARAIVEGQHPRGLSHRTLLQIELPIDWAQQRTVLGFA